MVARCRAEGINYRDTSAELRGCINDVYNMQKVLVEQYGFKIEVLMLQDLFPQTCMQESCRSCVLGHASTGGH